MSNQKPIIFFDGVCGLCNRFIDWLLKIDSRRNALLFATLQGETARELLPLEVTEKIDSMAFWVDGKVYYKSGGVLRTLGKLHWYFKPFLIFIVIPAPLRNLIYDFVANNRYKWFGKGETCRLPLPEEKAKFLP